MMALDGPIDGTRRQVLISDSPNGSYDSITAEKVVHVVRQVTRCH